MYAKFHNFPLRINKALGIFRKRVTTTPTTAVVAVWDPSGSKNLPYFGFENLATLLTTVLRTTVLHCDAQKLTL